MAELATIARPYADALFKASMADLDGAAVWVEELQGVASDVRIQQLADNPNVRADQVFDLITGVVQSTLPDMAKNFLRTVIANGRLSVLPEIAVQFRALKNAATGSADAVVYSAFAIDEAELKAASTTLEKRFGRPLNITVKLDPELIGGIRVVVGDEVLDSSVKARLEQMKAALTA